MWRREEVTMKICLKCPKTSDDFKSKKSFDLHEKTHLEDQVVCPDCNKKFKTKNMVYHRNRVHNQEEVFECNHCDKMFYQISNLTRHVKNFHDNSISGENIVYNCPDCNQEYLSKRSLIRHQKMNHDKTGIYRNLQKYHPLGFFTWYRNMRISFIQKKI